METTVQSTDKLKHGPIAWRTALRKRSRCRLRFAIVAPAVFLPLVAVTRLAQIAIRAGIYLPAILVALLQSRSRLAKFTKGHAGVLFGAWRRGVVGGQRIAGVGVEVRTNLMRGDLPSSQSTNREHALGWHNLPLRNGPTAQAQSNRQGDYASSLFRDVFYVHDAV